MPERRRGDNPVALSQPVRYHRLSPTHNLRSAANGPPLGQDTLPEEIWDRPISTILDSLGTTVAGLSRAEVDTRRRRYGLNQPLAHRRRPLWLQFLARFLNPWS